LAIGCIWEIFSRLEIMEQGVPEVTGAAQTLGKHPDPFAFELQIVCERACVLKKLNEFLRPVQVLKIAGPGKNGLRGLGAGFSEIVENVPGLMGRQPGLVIRRCIRSMSCKRVAGENQDPNKYHHMVSHDRTLVWKFKECFRLSKLSSRGVWLRQDFHGPHLYLLKFT
jgi:hypothetical protein